MRQKLSSRTIINFVLDSIIFLAFLATTAPRLTGLAIHEWLSIAFGAAIITHLLLHWNWIVQVARRFFGKVTWASRVNYLLNTVLFISLTVIIFTGLMISEVALPLFGIRLGRNALWLLLHREATDVMVLTLGLHMALHWRWIVNTTGRVFGAPFRPRPAAPAALVASNSTTEVSS